MAAKALSKGSGVYSRSCFPCPVKTSDNSWGCMKGSTNLVKPPSGFSLMLDDHAPCKHVTKTEKMRDVLRVADDYIVLAIVENKIFFPQRAHDQASTRNPGLRVRIETLGVSWKPSA